MQRIHIMTNWLNDNIVPLNLFNVMMLLFWIFPLNNRFFFCWLLALSRSWILYLYGLYDIIIGCSIKICASSVVVINLRVPHFIPILFIWTASSIPFTSSKLNNDVAIFFSIIIFTLGRKRFRACAFLITLCAKLCGKQNIKEKKTTTKFLFLFVFYKWKKKKIDANSRLTHRHTPGSV